LTLVEADALDFDYAALGGGLRIVATCPKQTSSPLLFRLAGYDASVRDLHVMLQREVVARMTANPGTADYGRLTVMLQVKFAIARLFVVPPGAFRPAPKVDSAVARLTPLGPLRAADHGQCIVRARGRGRRSDSGCKTLRNALSALCR